ILKGQNLDLSFLSTLLKRRNLANSHVFISVQTQHQQVTCARILDEIQDIESIVFLRADSYPSHDDPQIEECADVTLQHLVSQARATKILMHDYTALGLICAFKVSD
ncbi:hypothetical protein PFISCL1PPCAC_8908, partial [Pristionchus fissidentatus]